MQREHDSELLARAVSGELPPGDPLLEELFQRRPEWRDVLDELQGEDAAAEELAALARSQSTDGDRVRMGALVASVAADAKPSESFASRWRAPLLAAACLLALLGTLWWGRDTPATEAPRGPFLGDPSSGVSWITPPTKVGAWDEFAWEADLPRGGSYSLLVRSDDGQNTPLARAQNLREPRWRPDPNESEGWPDAIVVTIEVLERSGVLRSTLDVPLRR